MDMTCIIFMPVYVYVHLCLYTCSLQSKGIHSEQKYSEFSFDFIGTLPNYLHSNIKRGERQFSYSISNYLLHFTKSHKY